MACMAHLNYLLASGTILITTDRLGAAVGLTYSSFSFNVFTGISFNVKSNLDYHYVFFFMQDGLSGALFISSPHRLVYTAGTCVYKL